MTYGIAGLIAALGVFITTLYIFIVIYKGWDNMRPDVKANRLFMLSFAVLVTQAYLKRKKLATHKRLMFVATFYMLGPILGRVMGHSILNTLLVSDLSWDITFIGIWSLFFVSLLMYDWALLKKIHPVSYLGVLGFCVIWMISFLT
jgi:small-conductance mechanosensitive channel